MWTSRRSARELLAGLLAMAIGASAATGRSVAGPTPIDGRVEALTQRVYRLIARQDTMPTDRRATVRWSGAPVFGHDPGAQSVSGVAIIGFVGLANRYCRLVASVDGVAAAVFIPVPIEKDFGRCWGASTPQWFDLDGDGVDDLVFAATVKSNRADVLVEEPMVFIGRKDAPGGYCFSSEASDQLTPDHLKDPRSAIRVARVALKHSGKARFDCDRLRS